ncbi:MAG TPA: nucleotidyltransferase domain-containing protein [Dongiaceae bacterium]|nr:nucleotidyltransferase domain-containing protein [Dongiaceae bacterium]
MKPVPQSFLRYPLNPVFDSPANVRVLRSLARHGGALSAPSLAGLTKLTKPSVLSSLQQLIEARMVEALGAGRQRLYRFDDGSSLGAALGALFAAESERYRKVIEAIRISAERAGAQAAWLYGSVARDQDGPGSDIDVAIACPTKRLSIVTAGMREALSKAEERLGFTVSVIGIDDALARRLEREADPWWLAIKREAITVMGPAPESYVDQSRRKRRTAQ